MCQQAKPERVHYPGKLQPLKVPPESWHTISLDFIHGLPPSGRYNCILVVIDSFSKYGHFIPLRHPFTAAKIADVFVDTIYRLHGLPAAVVSDRDPIFTSTLWQGIFARVGTELCMSSSYHPQSDGQTERVNQTVECYLRCFISAHPQHWAKWLSLCELWYNTNWHSSTGKSPFEVVYGHPPRYFGVQPYSAIAADSVEQWLHHKTTVLASVKQHLERAKQRMKVQADKKRVDRQFEVGDMVFFKLQPYVQDSVADRSNQKLSFKYYGPYKVLARVGEVSYRLDLPAASKIHPVVHVSLLKRFLKPDTQVQASLPSSVSYLQIPEKFLQRRVIFKHHKNVEQVQVKWSHAPMEEATWEDVEALRQRFPRAPAWGQAGSEELGNVSNQGGNGTSASDPQAQEAQLGRPKRRTKNPAWMSRDEWLV